MKLGLLGKTLAHTLSPQIHARIFEKTGARGEYGVYEREPEELQAFAKDVSRLGLHGFNVTIPYKSAIIPYLEGISEKAGRLGAVNTVRLQDGRLWGENTDYDGFGYMLEKAGIALYGRRVAVLGTGGAARAAAVYAKDAGAKEVFALSRAGARAWIDGIAAKGYEDAYGDVLVNATPVGMFPDADACPIQPAVIARFAAVADLIYNPRRSRLTQTALEMGKKTADGLVMLVAQAVRAQEIWRGATLPPGIIESIAEEISCAL